MNDGEYLLEYVSKRDDLRYTPGLRAWLLDKLASMYRFHNGYGPPLVWEDKRHHEPCAICGKPVHSEYCWCWGCDRVYCDQHAVDDQNDHHPSVHK